MSSHLQWMLVRNNSAFLLKGAHGQTFTTVCTFRFYLLFLQIAKSLGLDFFGSSELNGRSKVLEDTIKKII